MELLGNWGNCTLKNSQTPTRINLKLFSYNVFEKTLLIYYKWICLENRSTYLTVIMSFLLWDANGGKFYLTTSFQSVYLACWCQGDVRTNSFRETYFVLALTSPTGLNSSIPALAYPVTTSWAISWTISREYKRGACLCHSLLLINVLLKATYAQSGSSPAQPINGVSRST